MSKTLADLIRLALLLLFLPLIIILIGPLLILAVIRGQQRFGPIMLNSSRYDLAGRLGIFMLGLALWVLVWVGVAWLAISAVSPPAITQVDPTNTPSVLRLPTATVTPANLPNSTATLPLPTPSATTTFNPSLTPTSSPPLTPSPTTPVLARAPSATPTGQTPQLTATVLPPVVITQAEVTSTLPVTVTPQSTAQPELVTVLEKANLLLQNAMNDPGEENLKNLDSLWQDRALTKVKTFAVDQHEKYAQPFNTTFEFLATPLVSEQVSNNQIVITSQERWSYGGPTRTEQESLEFIYTLTREDDESPWIITRYSYRNLPLLAPTDNPQPTASPESSN